MGPGEIILVALLMWLNPYAVDAGTLRQLKQQDEETVPLCITYTLSSLLHVDCSKRDLSELPGDLNRNVQILLLSDNTFTTFPPELEELKQLEVLDMSMNDLSSPLPTFMQSMDRLHTLNLSNNNYDVWVESPLINLKKLDLSKNKIQNIDDNAFRAMTELKYLDLTENRIRELQPKLFSLAKNLEILKLCRNYFSNFPRFQSDSLKSLYLTNCQITELERDSLSEMSSLLELYLSMNEIEMIPDNFSSNTLQDIDLSYNNIDKLTDNTFSSLPHLAVLDLRGNDFKEVWSTSHFASNPFLREVHVKGNRWSCENFHVNLLLLYEFMTKEPPKVTDRGSLICYSPSNVTQMNWQQAYIRTWHPNESSAMSYTTIAVLIGIVIGVVITSCVCRGLMAANRPDPPRQTNTVNLNGTTQPPSETSVLRIPLRDEDLPPSYDEALLMPRLNSSFHSLPDFVEDEEENTTRNYRRSRSIGDLTEYRPRTHDRRSIRRAILTTPNNSENDIV